MTQDTLEVVAGKINALQTKIGKTDQDRRDYIATRNVLIVEAHTRILVDKELDISFEAWVEANLEISHSMAEKIVHRLAPPKVQNKIAVPVRQNETVLYPRAQPAAVDPLDFVGEVSTDVLPTAPDLLAALKKAAADFTTKQKAEVILAWAVDLHDAELQSLVDQLDDELRRRGYRW